MILLASGVVFALVVAIPALLRAADTNGDNLDDIWEAQYGITTNAYASTNLVGWWRMQANPTNVVVDSSANQINGTLTNFPGTPFGTGLFSNALNFPATGQVNFPTNAAFNSAINQFTFSAWFQSTNNLSQPATIATWTDTQTNSWGVGADSSGTAGITFSDGLGNTQTITPTTGAIPLYDGSWHQVAVTFDTNQLATVYVDGQNQASGTITNWDPTSVASFNLGVPDDSSTNQPYALDDTRLYNRALGAQEVTQLPVTYTDLNGTGLSVYEDYLLGLNPISTNQIVTSDFLNSGLEAYYGINLPALTKNSGDSQVVAQSTFATNALTVQVRDSSGNPLVGAPITFNLAPGSDGGLAQTNGGTTVASISLTTDGSGNATIYFQAGADVIKNNSITATTVTNAGNVTATFTEHCGIQNGLVSWLDADAGVSVDGSNFVSQWQDESPAGTNSAAQATGGIQPQLVPSSLAGHSVIEFDGQSTYLAMPPCIADDFTMVVVFRSSAGSNTGGQWWNAGGIVDAETSGVVNDFGMSLDQYGDVLTGVGNPDTTQSSVVGGYNDRRAHIATFTRTELTGSFSQYVDSALQGTQSGNTAPLTDPPQITIGATQTLANYFGGDVAEVLLYSRNLSSDEQVAIEGYLADKYQIYSPDATWPQAYTTDVQAQIAANGWNKVQADAYVAFTSGTSVVPASGLLLWLTASAGVTTDPSGNVLQWVDQSPFGHVVPQSTEISPPTLATDINGNPCISFNGSQALIAPDYIPANGDITIIAVAADQYPGNFSMIETIGGYGSLNIGQTRSLSDTYGSQDFDLYFAGTSGGEDGRPGEQVVTSLSYQRSSGTAKFYLRGVANGAGNVTASDLSSGLFIGDAANLGCPWNGTISSILVYNRVLSDSERNTAEGYLADQYGAYHPDATWPTAYSADIQELIYENEWSKAQTDSYLASLGSAVRPPYVTPPGGHYGSAQTITVTSDTSDATIYYTTDGTTPTESSASIANGGTLTVSATSRYKFLASDGIAPDSSVTTAVYQIGDNGNLVVGDSFSMMRKSDGTVWTWGGDWRGQQGDNQAHSPNPIPQAVPGLSNVTAVSAAGDHALAVTSDGSAWAWGADDISQGGDGGTTDLYVPTQITSLSNIVSVFAGQINGFAVDNSGNLYGWGDNTNGQLGDGTTNSPSTPELITSVTGVTKVASIPNFTLALTSDGTVWATGINNNGELGDGTQNNETFFQQVPGLANVVDIAVGWGHAVALCSDGTVWTWGEGGYGALGHGVFNDSYSPQRVLGIPEAVAIAAANAQTLLVMVDGTVRSFGYNGQEQLGLGQTVQNVATPSQPTQVRDVVMLAAGSNHTVFCTSKGAFFGFGDNSNYRIGEDLNENTDESAYSEVHDPLWQGIASVASAESSTLALKSDGTVWAVGEGDNGVLGQNDWYPTERPVQVTGISNIAKLAAGTQTAFAIDSSGNLWSWGGNWNGQLALGTYNSETTPQQVTSLTNVTAVAGGDNHMLAIQSDGTLWACGDDSQGELGDGTTNQEISPIQVMGLTDPMQVAAGNNTSFVLQSDGTVWAWGQNDQGQLGLGLIGNVSTPTQITGFPAMVAISVHETNGVGIDTSGNVWAWGPILGNSDGTPLEQSGVSNVTVVAAGSYHDLAIASDGTLWGDGSDWNGQLGGVLYGTTSSFIQFADIQGAEAIAANYASTLLVKQDGTLSGYGYFNNDQLSANLGVYTPNPQRVFGFSTTETAPTISITSPATGAMETEGTPIAFQASASASAGSIAKVEYYLNGVKIGTSITAGTWDFSWTPTTYGDLTFEAVAVDTAGIAQISSPVALSVAYSTPTTPPTAPTSVTVTAGAPGTVYIGWTNGSGATSILIQEQNSDGSWTTIDTISDPSVVSAEISGLTTGQDYNFRVVESNSGGTASGSGAFSASSPNLLALTKSTGDEQSVAASSFATNPLTVQVKDSAGNPLSGVPVAFAIGTDSDGGLALSNGGTTASTQSVTTNAMGQTTVYYEAGDETLQNNTITASTPSGSSPVAVGFIECCGVASGLSLWFESDKGVTADGSGKVSAWADQSPNQFVANQSNSSSQPMLVSSAFLGAPALQFSGGQTLSGTGSIAETPTQGVTLIVLASNTSPGSQQYSIALGGAYTTGETRNMGYLSSQQTFSNCNSDAAGGSAPSSGVYVEDAATLDTDGTSVTFYRNGTQTATASVGSTGTDTAGFSVGSFVGGNFPWHGNIVEALAYNRTLSGGELAQVDGYLADKYGFYSPNAIWPLAYSSDVQELITANQWSKAQADAYVAFFATSQPVPATGLSLWLKADVGVTTDGDGNVSGWADQGPYGNNAGVSSSNRVTVISSGTGGKPMLHFNGSNWLAVPDAPSLRPSQITVLAVAQENSTATYQTLIGRAYRNTGWWGYPYVSWDMCLFGINGGNYLRSAVTTGGNLTENDAGNSYDVSQPHIFGWKYDGTAQSVYLTGSLTASTATTGDLDYGGGPANICIGARSDASPAETVYADVSEILVYDHALSSDDQVQAETYLADKYGLYYPEATWPLAYSSDVQAEITRNQWSKAQADNYVALQSNNPDMLTTGLKLWLKADSGVNQDGSGNVNSWIDQTGNYTVSQSGSVRPTYVASNVNGKPALHFNGGQTLYNGSNMGPGANSDLTMIAVCSSYNPGAQQYTIYLGNTGGYANRGLGYYASRQLFDLSNGNYSLGTGTPPPNNFVAEEWTLASNLSDVTFYRNGVSTGTASMGSVQNLTPGITIGGYNGYGTPWQGDIAEVLVYDHQLTSDETAQLYGYLSDKYGFYNTNATWPLAYSTEVQAEITRNQWTKAQADNYVAAQSANPDMLTDGMLLWLKADAGVAADGSGNVSAWADQTGNYNLTQGTTSNSPALVASDINGKPALHFSGNQWMHDSNSIGVGANGDMTMILVASTSSPGSQQYGLWLGATGTGYNRGLGYYNWSQIFDTYNIWTGGGSVPSANNFVVEAVTLSSDRTTATLYQNGTSTATNSSLGGIQNIQPGVSVGTLYGAGYNWNGDIAEALVYDHKLSSDELQEVSVYLADKYGLYNPNATWPLAYSSDVQAQITANQWNKSQADAYVAFLASLATFAADNPTLVTSGLTMWIKADGSVTADGSNKVSQWADQTPYANNANQSSSGNQPTLVTTRTDLNGKPVIRFDGGSTFLDVTDNASIKPANAITVIAIAQTNNLGTYQDIVSHSLSYNWYGEERWPLYSYDLGIFPNNVERGYIGFGPPDNGDSSAGDDLSGSTARATQMSISTLVYDGTNVNGTGASVNIYNSGTLQATAALSTPIRYDTNAHDLLVGAAEPNWGWGNPQYTDFFSGDIAEVLVYNRALTTAEKQQMEVYLADKYGVYHPDATWPSAYSSDVQTLIAANGWTKAEADAYVAYAASETTVPASGLTVWLKADSSVTADGSNKVSQWGDQTIYHNNANQSNSGNQPTFVASRTDLNDEPVIRFDGSSNFLDVTDTPSVKPTNAVTVIAVAQTNSSGQQDLVSHGMSYNWYSEQRWPLYSYDLGIFSNNVERGYIGFGPPNNGDPSAGDDLAGSAARAHQMSISSLTYDGAHLNIYEAGIAQGSVALSSPILYDGTTPHDLIVGAYSTYYGITNYFNGDMAEVFVYNRAITTTERQQIEGYLADKYGVYAPNATWPTAYSSDVQELITANEWTQAQADAYVTFAASESSVPSGGLSVWLKADTGVTADGSGKVSVWADQTPNGNNANQTNTGNQPTLVTTRTDLNGKPVIRFDGSTSYLDITDSPSIKPTQAITVVALAQTNSTATQDLVSHGLTFNYYGEQRWPMYSYDLGIDPNNVERGYIGFGTGQGDPSSGADLAGTGSRFDQMSISSMVFDGANLQIYDGGIAQGSMPVGAPILYDGTNAHDLILGAFSTFYGITNYFSGDMAEVLVYNRALTPTERQQAEGYLADKYTVYAPSATWPLAYSSEVQAQIAINQWNKTQADAYVAFQSGNSSIMTTGLLVWLKADAGVTADGSNNVSAWADQTGNYTVAQGTSGNQPTLVSSDINGKPALRFSGSQSLSQSTLLGAGVNQDMTIIAVENTTNPASSEDSIYLGSGGASRGIGYYNSDQYADFSSPATETGAAAPATGAFVTEAVTLDSTLQHAVFSRNGIVTGASKMYSLASVTAGLFVGNRADGTTPWQGDIAELLVFDHQLTASEMDQVGGYLGDKYGIYNPNATWMASYSSDVQARITAYQWSKAQADTYVAAHTGSPAIVETGLAMWLKADAGVTHDGSNNVSAWADQTGTYTLAQTGTAEPTYVASDINGKPAIRMNGSQFLASTGTLSGINADCTILTVASATSPSSQQYSVYVGSGGGSDYANRAIGYSSSQEFYDSAGSSTIMGQAPAANTFVSEAATLDSTLTNVTYYQNGNQTGTGTLSGLQNVSAGIAVGASAVPDHYWQGDISEVIVYDHKLSDSDMQQVDGYLADKYGLFDPNATWPSAYSEAVEVEIFKHQWNKAQADAYVAMQTANPSMLTNGLTLWFRADAGVTKDGSNNVTAIADQAAGYTATQTTSGAEPTWVASDINGSPALRFNGTQWLTNAGANVTGLNSDMTVITVAMTTAPTAQQYPLYLGANNGTAGIDRGVGYQGSDEFFDTDGSCVGGLAPATSTFAIESSLLEPGLTNVDFYQNGVSTGTGTLSGAQNLSPGITIGAATGGSSGWTGDVAEVLVYDHQLSQTELQQVTLYLAAKYGLAANGPAPTISPNGGSFSSTQSLTITTSISGATIHYTLDGTAPTANSSTYSTPISLSSSALVQAVAVSSIGIIQSQTASAQFYINDPSSTGLPPPPTGLTVTSTSPTRNSLSWSLGGAGTYNQIYIYRSTNGGPYQLIAVLSSTDTSFLDNTVTAGNSYTYEVGTVNRMGVGASAGSAPVTPLSNSSLDIVVTTPSGATPLP